MDVSDKTTITDYKWFVRHTIAQQIPKPIRWWLMGRYHWFFLQINRFIDLIRLSINGLGEKPQIYLPCYITTYHNAWRSYATHPPLRFTSYPLAQLCHWINNVPYPAKKLCVVECEHILALAGDITNWQHGLTNINLINRLVAQDNCRFVFTYNMGLLNHSKYYLAPELWHKFGYVYSASFPAQSVYQRPPNRPFTILTIASRFSDKGIPEVLEVFRVLHYRHGKNVRLILVSQAVPPNYSLPEGVVHYDIPRMSYELKKQLFQSAHVLFIPCYSDSLLPLVESCAFGVPIVFTRIHFSTEIVKEGVTGFLLDTPIYSYSEDYGIRWKTWEEFLTDLEHRRQRGDLQIVVDQAIDRLEAMISGQVDLETMGQAARQLHTEQFSPEVRNQRLLRLYQAALGSETKFPD
jgi:glycosyltransferase involved in cell wall biosynthesis